jgi:hypothetical protein
MATRPLLFTPHREDIDFLYHTNIAGILLPWSGNMAGSYLHYLPHISASSFPFPPFFFYVSHHFPYPSSSNPDVGADLEVCARSDCAGEPLAWIGHPKSTLSRAGFAYLPACICAEGFPSAEGFTKANLPMFRFMYLLSFSFISFAGSDAPDNRSCRPLLSLIPPPQSMLYSDFLRYSLKFYST